MQVVNDVVSKEEIMKFMDLASYKSGEYLACNNLEFFINIEARFGMVINITFELGGEWYGEMNFLYKIMNVSPSLYSNEIYLAIYSILSNLKGVLNELGDGRKISDCIKSVSFRHDHDGYGYIPKELQQLSASILSTYYRCFSMI